LIGSKRRERLFGDRLPLPPVFVTFWAAYVGSMRKRTGAGPFVAAAAVVGAILVALPYFGLGPDTSPDASSYLDAGTATSASVLR
jgi:drug/metabolite transporter (DMT)-like permease